MLDEVHVTRDGDKMLIAEMETDHLINYLYFMATRVRSLYEAARQPVVPEQTYHHKRLYGDRSPKVTEEDAALTVIVAMKRLYPYMAEVLFRLDEVLVNERLTNKLNDTRNIMGIILERGTQLPRLTGAQVYHLTSGTTIIDYDVEDEEDVPF